MLEGLEYQFRIIAENEVGLSHPGEASKPVEVVSAVGPPYDLQIVDMSRHSISLTWKKPLADGGSKIAYYFVERRHVPDGRWLKCNFTNIANCGFEVTGLTPNDSYEFRVIARNAIGTVGIPSEVLGPILCKPHYAPPGIELDSRLMSDVIQIRAGDVLRIEAEITGKPQPHVFWSKGEKELEDSDRVSILTTKTSATLIIKDVFREDTARYNVLLRNECGEKQATVNVKVLDKPGKPNGPIIFSRVSAEKCNLSWKRPDEDGGADITHYVVEKRETSRISWVVANEAARESTCTVTNLLENNEYIFRVSAVNKYGQGAPLESNLLIAKNQFTVPSAPGRPEVVASTKDSITITWTRPDHDGGNEIKTYVIEKREKQGFRWIRCNNDQEVTDYRFRVGGLRQNADIEFRIGAANDAGCGPFSESSAFARVQEPMFPPASPTNFKVIDSTKTSISMAWKPPLYDGGSPILGYVLEFTPFVPDFEAEEWKAVHKSTHIFATEYTTTDLVTGKEYKFRIYAVNDQGVSEEPTYLKEKVTASEILEEPELQLDDTLRKTVNVRAGKPLRLLVFVKGRPTPTVSWSKTPAYEELSARAYVDTHEAASKLEIEKTNRYDAGKYAITLENVCGKKEQSINVRIHDTPGPPGTIKVCEATRSSATISWQAPEVDGGSVVHNYIVEKREATRKSWTTVVTKCHKMSFKITKLMEGASYFFRVLGENEYGVGEGRETNHPIKISEPPSPPESVEATSVTDTTVTLVWEKPHHDGGARIESYVLEMLPKGTDKWIKICSTKDLLSTVKGLKCGNEYYFRVKAKNENGFSEPKEMLSSVLIKAALSAPEIDLSSLPQKTLCVKAGSPICIKFPISGQPIPTILWQKDGTDIKEDLRRVIIKNTSDYASIEIRESTMEDRGDYRLTLTNASGTYSQVIKVILLDAPLPPQGPFDIQDMTSNSLTLHWKPPLYEGGSAISNYIVEKRETHKPNWFVVSATVTRTNIKVTKLKEDCEYAFRVKAQNRFGISKALTSEDVLVKSLHKVPGPPGQPHISAVSKDSMTVIWMEPVNDGGSEITGYFVERKEPKASRWIRATRTPISQTRFVSNGLIEGVEYVHRIIAVNARGEGKPSKETDISICQEPITPPSAPRNPRVIDITKNTISFAWDAPEYEGGGKLRGYFIEIRTEDAWWERCNATPIRITEYTLKGLPEGGKFYFRVMALNAGGTGQPTELVEPVIIKDESGPPIVPLALQPITVRCGGILRICVPFKCRPFPQVEWSKAKSEPFDLFLRGSATLSSEAAEYIIKKVDRRDAGEYKALFSNKFGEAVTSVRVNVIGKPDAPEGPLQFGDIQATSLTLVWKLVLNDGGSEVTNYVVEKREVGKTAWFTVDSKIHSTHCLVKGLNEGKEYYFKVYAENIFGLGQPLECSEPVTPKNPLYPPQPPLSVEINEVCKDRVFLAWTRPREDGGSRVTGYFVERREATSDKWIRVNKVLITNLSFVVQGLVEYAEYQFRVVAVNDVGEGEPSQPTEIIASKDPFDKPSPPESIEVHHTTKDSVTLAWNKPEFDGGKPITGYMIEYRSFGMTMWKKGHEDLIRDRVYQVGGLDQGAEYEFRIFAANQEGKSRPKMMETPVSTKAAAGEKPVIVQPLGQVTGLREEVVELTCEISGRPIPDITWTRLGKELKSGRKYKMISKGQVNALCISNVADDDEGSYYVVAKNNVGTADCEGQLVVEGVPLLSDDNNRFKPKVSGKHGQTIRIHMPYRGRPQAHATWTKDGRRLENGERYEIETTESYSHIVIKTANRAKDVGKYQVTLKNKHGQNIYAVVVDIQDVPSPPHSAEVSDIKSDSMVLSWKEPIDDGGAPVSKYIIEKRDIEEDEDNWRLVTSATSQTSYKVERLIEKHAYYFRIYAENCFGLSRALETDAPIAAKLPHDVPLPPTQPKASGISKDGCMLTWKQPKSNDGLRISEYIVERRDSMRPRWMRINKETLTQSVYNVTCLVESCSYEFRVISKNAVGASEPSEVSEAVVPKDDIRIVAPKFVDNLREVVVKPEQTATFSCKVSGQPKPVVKWYRNGREISGCSKYQMREGKGNHYSLLIANANTNDECSYTVRAINQGGSISHTAELIVQLAAKVNLPKYMQTEATECKVHEVLSVKVPFEGKPQPDVTWTKAGRLVNPDSHHQFITTTSFSTLTITNAGRNDSGFYNVTVQNRFGSDQATVEILVGDVPSKPENLTVSNVTRDSVDLAWKEPRDDGGKPILKYIIEMCTSACERWLKLSSSSTTHYTVCNLSGKTAYEFRILAENHYGKSAPSYPSNSITTKKDRFLASSYDDMIDATEKFFALEPEVHQNANATDKYQILEQLGRGAFGTVHRAREILTGKIFAVKLIKTSEESDKAPIHREIEIMRQLQHPRVLQLHEVFDTKGETALVIQFVSGGDLIERVASSDFAYNENVCAYLMKQVCQGITYIHSKRIAHLDIKPENVLFVTRKSKKIKIIDFGVSRQLKTGDGKYKYSVCFIFVPSIINSFETSNKPSKIRGL